MGSTSGWGAKIPYAEEQQSPCVAITELVSQLESLCSSTEILHDSRKILSATTKTQRSQTDK